MPTKISDLGLFWVQDNLRIAEQSLHRVQDSLENAREGPYKEQMLVLEAGWKEVVEVWRRHVDEARKNRPVT